MGRTSSRGYSPLPPRQGPRELQKASAAARQALAGVRGNPYPVEVVVAAGRVERSIGKDVVSERTEEVAPALKELREGAFGRAVLQEEESAGEHEHGAEQQVVRGPPVDRVVDATAVASHF